MTWNLVDSLLFNQFRLFKVLLKKTLDIPQNSSGNSPNYTENKKMSEIQDDLSFFGSEATY
jgi:hypothetical protein